MRIKSTLRLGLASIIILCALSILLLPPARAFDVDVLLGPIPSLDVSSSIVVKTITSTSTTSKTYNPPPLHFAQSTKSIISGALCDSLTDAAAITGLGAYLVNKECGYVLDKIIPETSVTAWKIQCLPLISIGPVYVPDWSNFWSGTQTGFEISAKVTVKCDPSSSGLPYVSEIDLPGVVMTMLPSSTPTFQSTSYSVALYDNVTGSSLFNSTATFANGVLTSTGLLTWSTLPPTAVALEAVSPAQNASFLVSNGDTTTWVVSANATDSCTSMSCGFPGGALPGLADVNADPGPQLPLNIPHDDVTTHIDKTERSADGTALTFGLIGLVSLVMGAATILSGDVSDKRRKVEGECASLSYPQACSAFGPGKHYGGFPFRWKSA